MSNQYYYGQGSVSMAPVVNGTRTGGFTEVGDADLLEFNPSQEFLDILESKSGSRRLVVHAPTSSRFSFNLQLKEITPENLEKAFYGTNNTNAAGTGVTETQVAYAIGDVIPLSKINVSNVSVSDGGSLLTEGTDYSVAAGPGSIKLLPGTSVTPGSSLDITFDHAASSTVDFATQTIKNFAIRFEGINVATGQPEVVTIENVALHMSTTLSLIDTTESTLTMGGEALPNADDKYVTYTK
jgi:hypothetical protein